MEIVVIGRHLISCEVRGFPSVEIRCWTEVKCRSNLFSTDVCVPVKQESIASFLHDIDFTRSRPFAVDAEAWHHPQSRPQPITSWRLCAELNGSVLESERIPGIETSTSDRVDNAVDRASSVAAVPVSLCTLISWDLNAAASQKCFSE